MQPNQKPDLVNLDELQDVLDQNIPDEVLQDPTVDLKLMPDLERTIREVVGRGWVDIESTENDNDSHSFENPVIEFFEDE